MNDEIKVILNYLDIYKNMNEGLLNSKDKKLLLDYITNLQTKNEYLETWNNEIKLQLDNLQQENERLKKVLNCKEYFSSTMPEDTEFVILTKNNYDRQQKDIQFELIDYKSRCEKAIEYINKNLTLVSILDGKKFYGLNDYKFSYQNLLNILQNGDDEE